jgi:A/G-specific adenine glycosylase
MPWFWDNRVDYPWRSTRDPYAILIAELMLHRTRAPHVRSVYLSFMARFPDLDSALSGTIAEMKQILYPLGLTGRAERFKHIFQELKSKYGSVVTDRTALLSIYGVGPYIAGAVSVFSGNKPEVLVDTNVVRVVGRVFGLQVDAGARRRKAMLEAIGEVIDLGNPRDFYYAVIDLAHTICRPQKPLCNQCPLRDYPCQYALELYGTYGQQNNL